MAKRRVGINDPFQDRQDDLSYLGDYQRLLRSRFLIRGKKTAVVRLIGRARIMGGFDLYYSNI